MGTGLTYDDLWELPQDDGLRRELIDGELFVSPSPVRKHQRAVVRTPLGAPPRRPAGST